MNSCASLQAAQHVYEAVLNDKPVTTLYLQTEHGKSHAARQAVGAVLDPLHNAYSKSIDTQLHREPLWHMHDAELTWSILSTDMDYTVFGVQGPYKALNNSLLFSQMEPLKLDETKYPENLDRYEEVTAHLKVSHSLMK